MNLLRKLHRPFPQVLLVLVLAGALIQVSASQKTGHVGRPAQQKNRLIAQVDIHRRWTLQWVKSGIPSVLGRTGAGVQWVPWIVSNPQNTRQTWWVWPLAAHNAMFFGQSRGASILWQKINITSPRGLPFPWQQMMTWTHDFVRRHAPPPVPLSPSSQQWYTLGNRFDQVRGFMMAMQTRPKTVALGVLLKSPRPGWIQLVGIWQWKHRWIAHYLIINPEPAILNTTNLLMPPDNGLPLPLPLWAR